MKEKVYNLERNYMEWNRARGSFEFEPCDDPLEFFKTIEEGMEALKKSIPESKGREVTTYSLVEYVVKTDDEQKDDDLDQMTKDDIVKAYNECEISFPADYLDDGYTVARYDPSYNGEGDIEFTLE
jgi:hypothetical protein